MMRREPVGRGWTGPGPGEDTEGRHRRALDVPTRPQVTERDMPDLAAVRARHQNARMAGEHADHASRSSTGRDAIPQALLRSWDDVSDLHDSLRVLAVDVLAIAQAAGMPSAYWHSDRRMRRSLSVLDLTPEQAQQIDWSDLPG